MSRREVRRRGGLAGIVTATSVAFVGMLLRGIIGGVLGGLASFACLVLAIPAMPFLGIPASGGALRTGAAVLISAALWWFLGRVAAGRATRRPVAGWREWLREFAVLGVGVWAGAAGGVVLAALLLGAL